MLPNRLLIDHPLGAMMKNNIPLLIVEPEPMTRRGLALTFRAAGFDVIAAVAQGTDVLRGFDGGIPAVATVEVSLPDVNGLDLIEQMRAAWPEVRVLATIAHADAFCTERILRAGACGLVLRHETPEAFVAGVRRLAEGGFFLSAEVVDSLCDALIISARPLVPAPADVLSARELELFELTGVGRTTGEIADHMGVSVKTVESYRTRAKEKLNVVRTTDFVRQAVQWASGRRTCYVRGECGEEGAKAHLVLD